jgi:hypothetical protein
VQVIVRIAEELASALSHFKEGSMRQTLMVVLLLGCVLAAAMPVVAAGGAATMIAPPAIYMPSGGKVVTEINVSDDDVLGIIKQAIPAIGDAVKDLGLPTQPGSGDMNRVVAMAGAVDMQGLSEAIQGITNVRLLVVRYPGRVSPEKFVDEFTVGAAKAGQFNKIATDFGMFPGALGVYALPNNAGCMGFVYIPDQRTAYAVRVVGGVDVPKLIKWGGGIAKLALTAKTRVPVPEPEPQPAAPAEAPEAAPEK